MQKVVYQSFNYIPGFPTRLSTARNIRLSFAIVSLIIFSLGTMTACVNTSVTIDYDPATNFSTIKTFAWQDKTQPQTGDYKIDNTIVDKRVRSAIDSRLNAKGLTQVPANQAEILVSYQIAINPKLRDQNVSGAIGLSKSSGGSNLGQSLGIPLTHGNYDEGTMILDITETKSNLIIWRGVAGRQIDPSASAQENADKVKKLVSEMLDGFPPESME